MIDLYRLNSAKLQKILSVSLIVLLSIPSGVLAKNSQELTVDNNIEAKYKPNRNQQHTAKQIESDFLPSSAMNGQKNKQQLAQLVNVRELKDVRADDWAYEALRSLADRYGCISGYPNGTYRGDRVLTRYEFAAGLNSCLNQIERLIADSDSVAVEDIATIERLSRDFATELENINSQMDNIENKLAEVEDNRFSTTSKLFGEVVFALAGVATGNNPDGEEIPRTTTFSNRVRLDFIASFTGEDQLIIDLEASNTAARFDYFEGALSFEFDNENDLEIGWLAYYFPISERTQVVLQGVNGLFFDYADTVTVFDGDGGSGALSYFGTRNPIYNTTFGAGIGITHKFSDLIEVAGGYLASGETFADPSPGNGIFAGDFASLAQVVIQPSDKLKFAIAYVHGYNSEPFSGSALANFRSFTAINFGEAAPINSDAIGVDFSWSISDRLILGGWGTYTNVSVLDGQFEDGSLDTWTGAVTLAVTDLITEGSLAGIIVGVEPKVTSSDGIDLEDRDSTDSDTSLHIEALYQLAVSDNITITPGVIWLTAPDHNDDNDDVVVGVVRTTFKF